MSRSFQRRLAVLAPLLVVITASELALNRLAVPTLRIPSAGKVGVPPPHWYRALDYVALFLHYFASILAIAAVALLSVAIATDRATYGRASRYPLAVIGACFAVLAAAAVVASAGEGLTFALETAFTALLLCAALAQIGRGGSVAAKLGVGLLALPLVLRYYGPLMSATAAGSGALWLELPDQLRAIGQWGVVVVALFTPYMFSPKPAARALAHPAAAAVAVGLSAAGGLLLHFDYEVAMIVASRGFGLEIGPALPAPHLALYLVALASIAWTTMACLTAPAPARRAIGTGLALVIVGGYDFAWPLHHLAAATGLLVIADAARRVKVEERALSDGGTAT